MKKKNLVYSLLLFPVLILFTTQCQNEPVDGKTGIARSAAFGEPVEIRPVEPRPEEKIYWNGTIDEDFDGSSVLVMLDKSTGGINKPHKESFLAILKKSMFGI